MRGLGEFYKNNFKKCLVAQILLCVLSIVIIKYSAQNEQDVFFDKNNLSGGSISEEGFFSIDENDGNYGYILDVTTGEIKRGWYKVRIEYETGYDDNGFIVQALKTGNVLNEDIGNEERAVSLKSYHNSQEVHAWLKKDSDLRIAVHFCGGGYLTVKRILLYQIPDYTPAFLLMALLLFANVELYEIGHFTREEVKRRLWAKCVIAGIALLGSIPLMNDFVIHGHDYRFHIYRIEGIAEGLQAGQFPVKVMPNWWNEFGYGAPLFYGDIFLYFPAMLTLLGYSIQTAYKFYIVVFNLMTAWIAYACFLKIAKDDKIALFGAFLYSLSLYRLINIYIRCALGEYTALAFLPLILLGIYLIEEKNGWFYMVLGLTGCIQSHVLSCMMVSFLFILFCIIRTKWIFSKRIFLNLCKAGIITILWNLWFIIPFLNSYLGNDYKIHFLETEWKLEDRGIPVSKIFKLYIDGAGDSIFALGLPLMLALILAVVILLVCKKNIFNAEENKIRNLLKISVFFAMLTLLMSTNIIPYSRIESIHPIIHKLVNIIQFPFRFICMVSVFSSVSIVCAYTLWKLNIKNRVKRKFRIMEYAAVGGIIVAMILEILISYWNLLTNDFPYAKTYEYNAVNYVMESKIYLPAEANDGDVSHELLTSEGNVMVSDYKKEYTNIAMTCMNAGVTEGYIDVPLFFYPCYKAKDVETRESLFLTYGENCRIRIMLPPGYQGMILLEVSERKLWRMAELISVLSVLAVLYVMVKEQGIGKIMKRIGKGKQDP